MSRAPASARSLRRKCGNRALRRSSRRSLLSRVADARARGERTRIARDASGRDRNTNAASAIAESAPCGDGGLRAWRRAGQRTTRAAIIARENWVARRGAKPSVYGAQAYNSFPGLAPSCGVAPTIDQSKAFTRTKNRPRRRARGAADTAGNRNYMTRALRTLRAEEPARRQGRPKTFDREWAAGTRRPLRNTANTVTQKRWRDRSPIACCPDSTERKSSIHWSDA